MDKHNVVYKHSGILTSYNKEGNSDTFYTRVNFEDILPSKVRQIQKNKY